MKLVKLSVLTLCLGVLVSSCGNAGGEGEKKDSTAAPAPMAAPAPKVDSMKKDSTAAPAQAAPAPEKK